MHSTQCNTQPHTLHSTLLHCSPFPPFVATLQFHASCFCVQVDEAVQARLIVEREVSLLRASNDNYQQQVDALTSQVTVMETTVAEATEQSTLASRQLQQVCNHVLVPIRMCTHTHLLACTRLRRTALPVRAHVCAANSCDIAALQYCNSVCRYELLRSLRLKRPA